MGNQGPSFLGALLVILALLLGGAAWLLHLRFTERELSEGDKAPDDSNPGQLLPEDELGANGTRGPNRATPEPPPHFVPQVSCQGRVLNPEGKPIAGALVVIPGPRAWLPMLRAAQAAAGVEGPLDRAHWPAGLTTRTDRNGTWSLSLDRGELGAPGPVFVLAPGFATGRAHPLDAPVGGREGLTYANSVLPPAATAFGFVRAADGRAVPDVLVLAMQLVPLAKAGEGGFQSRYARSDAEGRYRFEGLAADAAYVLQALPRLGPPGPPTPLRSLRSGRATQVEIRLPEGLDLDGVVLDAAGSPMPDAVVRLRDASTQAAEHPHQLAWSQARTDAAGRFTFRGLGTPPWTLEFDAEGHFGQRLRLATSPAEQPLRVAMAPAARIAGRVREGPHALSLGIEGAPRLATQADSFSLPEGPLKSSLHRILLGAAASTALGEAPDPSRFLVVGIAREDLGLVVEGAGFERQLLRIHPLQAGELRECEVNLRRGRAISGRIAQAAGPRPQAALAGATIVAFSTPSIGSDGQLLPQRIVGRTKSDAEGRYRLFGLPEEAVKLIASHPLHESSPATVAETPAGGDVEQHFALHLRMRIEALLRDAQGRPSAGRRVHLQRYEEGLAPRLESRTSDAQGRVSFRPPEAGTYRVFLGSTVYSSAGYFSLAYARIPDGAPPPKSPQDRILRCKARELARTELELPAEGSVMLEVFAAGRPLPGARVRLQVPPPAFAGSFSLGADAASETPGTDAAGRFRWPRVAAGHYLLSVQAPGAAREHREELRLTAGQELLRRVELPNAGFTGRIVRGPDERPVADARIRLLREEERFAKQGLPALELAGQLGYRELRTDADGRFTLKGVPPAYPWTLQVRGRRGVLLESGPHTTAPQTAIALGDLRLPEHATLILAWDDQAPLSSHTARISLSRRPRSGDSKPAETVRRTLKPGAPPLRIEALPAGFYRLGRAWLDAKGSPATERESEEELLEVLDLPEGLMTRFLIAPRSKP